MWPVSLFTLGLLSSVPAAPGCDLSSGLVDRPGLEERTARVPAGGFAFPLSLLCELLSSHKAKLLTLGGRGAHGEVKCFWGRIERLSAFAGGNPASECEASGDGVVRPGVDGKRAFQLTQVPFPALPFIYWL